MNTEQRSESTFTYECEPCIASLDKNSIYATISLEENITICTKSIYNQNKQNGFKKYPYLVTKYSYFIFNGSF